MRWVSVTITKPWKVPFHWALTLPIYRIGLKEWNGDGFEMLSVDKAVEVRNSVSVSVCPLCPLFNSVDFCGHLWNLVHTYDMTNGYTKLFGSLVTSSVWSEDDKTRIVWITMLALSNRDGVVEAATPGLARAANVALDDCRAALLKFESPDPESRSLAFEGRRVERVDGGFKILNYEKYMRMMDEESRREYKRNKQAEYRARDAAKAKENGSTIRQVIRRSVENDPLTKQDRRELRRINKTSTIATKFERAFDIGPDAGGSGSVDTSGTP